MGRAYEVRKASIQKTGAIKAKTYSLFAKEIYLAAKNGTPEIESNIKLKRLVEKAKKSQVPNDIIERAIEKAKGSSKDDYQTLMYEGFGPGSSTIIIKCLTDNVNRTISDMKTAFNKTKSKLGVSNSVSYNYDNLCIISFKTNEEEKVLEELLNKGIEIVDLESENDYVIIYGNPTDYHAIKDAIENSFENVEYDLDEIGYYPKEKVTLSAEDKELFDRLYNLLDDIEDVQAIYHNVEE